MRLKTINVTNTVATQKITMKAQQQCVQPCNGGNLGMQNIVVLEYRSRGM